ncbi:hypothetical protein A1O3_00419 [Capronia epimyces CBS 606.96]|uniref:Major facilitator superfamily (MFS) profile domain-containing protein n=1 Tax=Capronia epimyces CBS 606.96 TaxID=1182542 RepID=W9ZBJ7_9EURO|nr:uncharacterized protein A1O3_00419 [Capronia epimyces CBS 606.96]EXJ91869.1 hypothetical protein A1O3_00419 [Capronia epimyces CBS 606.96]
MSKAPEISVDVDADDGTNHELRAARVVAQTPKQTRRGWFWDTLDKSPEERRFLFKLDTGLLTIVCFGFFVKFLDQANLNNAFVSGMKEDLNMFGNQLNYVTTIYTVGSIVGNIPSNLLMTRIRPSIWLPNLKIIWSVLTMCLSRVNNTKQLYALRFFIGLSESGFYPGVEYMLGSWYRRDELAKRAGIFNFTGSVATMFSGYLMSAVISLDGRGGLRGWQWLFIMDGVISLPIAIASFFLLPDYPEISRVWYLNEGDKAIARKRMEFEGRRKRQPFTKKKVLKILSSWHLWLLPLPIFFCAGAGGGGQPTFALWLKASKHPKYTISQINTYPTTVPAMQAAATLAYTWISDSFLRGRRWPIMLWATTINFIVFTSLAVWNIPVGWHWACYILMGQAVATSPLMMTWTNELCSGDAEERALVLAVVNDFLPVMNIWLPLLIWQQVDAPRYHTGFITASCLIVVGFFLILAILYLSHRDRDRHQQR